MLNVHTVVYVVWRDTFHADALLEATRETKNRQSAAPVDQTNFVILVA